MSPWRARDLEKRQSRRALQDRCSISLLGWDAGSEWCGIPWAIRTTMFIWRWQSGPGLCFASSTAAYFWLMGWSSIRVWYPLAMEHNFSSLHCFHGHFSTVNFFCYKCEIQKLITIYFLPWRYQMLNLIISPSWQMSILKLDPFMDNWIEIWISLICIVICAPLGARAYPWILSKYFLFVRASVRPSVCACVPLQISVGCVYFV